MFDVRFMQNPYYVAELRPLSGLTDEVRDVRPRPAGRRAASSRSSRSSSTFAIPAYVAEGKTRLTIAIGCTGGYHRSIVVAEELAAWLREQDFGPVAVFHRELDRTMNLRRWLTPGSGSSAGSLVVFVGPPPAGPRLRPLPPPGHPRPRAGRARPGP